MSYRSVLLVFLNLGLLGALNGCRQPALPRDDSKLLVFSVSFPVQREVTDYVEYTGRTGAVEAEEIKACVTGFLVDAPFEEGKEIKKNDILFEIDPRPYQASTIRPEPRSACTNHNSSLTRRIMSAIPSCSREPREP